MSCMAVKPISVPAEFYNMASIVESSCNRVFAHYSKEDKKYRFMLQQMCDSSPEGTNSAVIP